MTLLDALKLSLQIDLAFMLESNFPVTISCDYIEDWVSSISWYGLKSHVLACGQPCSADKLQQFLGDSAEGQSAF